MLERAVDRRSFAFLAAGLATALLLALGALRDATRVLAGDEPTFVAMAASLARDGDLRFEEADAEWARTRPGRPAGLILQKTPPGITYSKPVLFPLLAAPFLAAAGERGLDLFQLVALGAALAVARAALARRSGGARALETLLCFAFASIVVPHLAWRTTEILQLSLATAGLALALGGELAGDGSSAAQRHWLTRAPARLVGAALLGLLVALREPNGLVALVPIAAALLGRHWKRSAALAAASALAYGAVVALTVLLTGAPNPYKAWRSTFDATTGYPAGPGSAAALARFEGYTHLATSDLGAVPRLDLGRSAYASLYFFVGRHSGLVAYFPAALALLWAASRRRRAGEPRAWLGRLDRVGRAALFGFVASALFYLVWWPENYFGGSTHLGNRYLLAAYPCLLFVPRVLPSRRALAGAWVLAFALGVSALGSVVRLRAIELPIAAPTSSHAHAGLFRLLPYESVARAIDGRRDRYWAGDFLRFVDPFARADATSFTLVSRAPAAEVELTTAWQGSPLRFLAIADSPRAALTVRDWAGSSRFELAPDGRGGAGGVVEVVPSSAWRFHRFWWPADRAYRARMLRFELESEHGGALRLRYLGRGRIPEGGFARELVRLELPREAEAGARTTLEVALRNRSAWTWSSNESLPVFVAARLASASGEIESRAPFEQPVAPGGEVVVHLPIDWPRTPGDVRLTVDLVLEDVGWFAEKVGEPLGAATVRVTSPPAAR